ncbi:DNA polymerase eta-like [Sitodiplosis mosellana]|uniref:DNA polymerase eta-like n=1 Tax=Sitodiplosis mosellana TaxID=263140 RepID=UPI0024451648|nr:DNA polymerase eta-like [Sitodiplosis mosellana]
MMWTPQKNINNKYDRIIALIDMDCFYCQVEERLNPSLKGKPIIVQPLQYDDYGGGGIIALNYVAKARGVKRSMRGDEAKKQCPDLELVRVPVIRGKADLSKYRNAGKQVAAVLQTFTPLMTRASVDEAYLDLTERVQNRLADMNKGTYSLHSRALESTFAVGYETIAEYVQYVTNKVTHANEDAEDDLEHLPEEDQESFQKSDIKLLIASSIVNEIRAEVLEKTGFECSAGIAHNKTLAKLVCGLNKPNKQTLLPLKRVHQFYRTLPIKKVQGLGGKLGEKICEDLNVQFMSELLQFSKEDLLKQCDERNSKWLYNLARGIDLEAVTPRLVPKSISCSKMFPRQNAIADMSTLNHWLHEIVKDVVERVEEDEFENNRRPKQIVVSFSQSVNNADVSSSRSINFTINDEDKIVNDAIEVIRRNTSKFLKPDDEMALNNPIKFLGFNVCKFESLDTKRGKTIEDMFRRSFQKKEEQSVAETSNGPVEDDSMAIETSIAHENQNEQPQSSSLFDKYHIEFNVDDVDSSDDEESESGSPIDALTKAAYQMNQNIKNHLLDSPGPSTSTRTNYEQNYAEFYRPTAQEQPKTECSQCGKMILVSEMQVHTDAHLAFQLNQEQRAEFQNQLKRTNPSNTPVKKKQKVELTKSSDKKAETTSIQKFLVKKRETTPEPSTSTAVEVKKCTECGKAIPIIELFEHMDFHAAKRLHDELMKNEAKANRSNNNSVQKSINNILSASKSKKGNKKGPNTKNPAVRNITAFFQSIE